MDVKNLFKVGFSKIFDNLISQIIGLILGSALTIGLILRFKDFLFQSIGVQIIVLILFVTVFIFLLNFFIRKKIKKKEYFIPTRRTLHSGLKVDDYSRQIKWHYKNYNQFYFIPLISHSYNSAEFITFCGPFCAKCDHFLQIDELTSKPEFFCINCIKKYKVPFELLGSYDEKLFAYFKEEYRNGNLKGK